MAQKRMFDRAIIETDKFLNISLSAKALYFLLGMEADDEGFVSPSRVMRTYGAELGDLKNLIDTGLVIPFKSGVVVITDWKQNNWLDSRRIKPTQYQEEKKLLELLPSNKYMLSDGLASIEESRGEERSIVSNEVALNPIIDLFKSVNPTFEKLFRNKTQRAALERLIKKFGEKHISEIISVVLPKTNVMKYSPKIYTPLELEDKLGKLKDFILSENSTQSTFASKISFYK